MNSLPRLIKVIDMNKNTSKNHEWLIKTGQDRVCYRAGTFAYYRSGLGQFRVRKMT